MGLNKDGCWQDAGGRFVDIAKLRKVQAEHIIKQGETARVVSRSRNSKPQAAAMVPSLPNTPGLAPSVARVPASTWPLPLPTASSPNPRPGPPPLPHETAHRPCLDAPVGRRVLGDDVTNVTIPHPRLACCDGQLQALQGGKGQDSRVSA